MSEKRLSSRGYSVLSFAILIVIWFLITNLGLISRAFFPSPQAVWLAFVNSLQTGTLFDNLWISILRLIATYIGASILGMIAGVAMGLQPNVGRFFRPILSFFNAISGITWIPFAITWFGIGNMTIAFVIFNSVFFIVAFNTMAGIRAVPEVFEHALLTMGSSRLGVIRDVLLPGALPSIITGQRLALGFGWRGLIAAEMVAGSIGIGFMIFNASYDFRPDIIMMGILVVGVVSSIIDYLFFAPLERYTIERWGMV